MGKRSKQDRKQPKRGKRNGLDRRITDGVTEAEGLYYQKPKVEKVSPIDKFEPTPKQEGMLETIDENIITFVEAPAGTGKSSVALYYACQRYLKARGGEYKIFVVRSPEQIGENLGALKGELEEKLEPVFAPAAEILNKFLGRGVVSTGVKNGNIKYVTPTFMLGCTIDAPAFVLIDEAQQLTPQVMSLLLTRIGRGDDIRVVVAGDRMQKYSYKACGLTDAINRFTTTDEDGNIIRKFTKEGESIGYFEFNEDDIMRHGVVKTIISQYRKDFQEK